LSLRYILLGVLAENSNHGYALKKLILHRLGHFRNINEGQLYTELAKMEKEGLTEREVEVPDKGPARKRIHITPKGRQAFQDWMLSDQYEDNGVLYDFMQGYPFLTKLSFFDYLDPEEARKKIDQQIALVQRKKEAYETITPQMKERGADRFRIRILEFGTREQEHRIQWLESLKDELQPEGQEA